MSPSDPQKVYLGDDLFVWQAPGGVTLQNAATQQSITLSPEAMGEFMDWLHDIIQSNPEGKVFTRDVAP
jgi:hypothetical protein